MKRFTIGMALMLGLMLGWQWWYQSYYLRKYPHLAQQKTQPAELSPNPAPPAGTQPASNPSSNPATGTVPPTPAMTADNSSWASLRVVMPTTLPSTAPATTLLGSVSRNHPAVAIGAGLSARGASIRSITLNEFSPSNISLKERSQPGQYTFQRPLEDDTDHTAPLATRWVKFKQTDGTTTKEKTIDLDTVAWQYQADQSSANKAVWAIDINDGDRTFARIIKEYELLPRSDSSMGYEMIVRQRVINRTAEGGGSGQKLDVSTMIAGPTLPPRELESNDDRYIVSAVGQKSLSSHNHPVAKFGEKEPTFDLTKKEEEKAVWFGTASAYFTAIVRPEALDQIVQIWAQTPNAAAPVDDRQVTLTLTTRDLPVEAGKEVVVPLRVYFGPKSRAVLQSSYYTTYQYAKTLETSASSCSAYCAPDWLSWVLVKMLTTFHIALRDWGLAIIALVMVVRLVLHPITKKSTISMQRMQKLGPEMERLKQKLGDNKDELNKAMMGLYKEQGIAPMLGCLPMFLQMPIWIALYSTLQNTFELRQAGFLEFGSVHLTWIRDLSQPDRLFEFASSIPLLFGWKLHAINVLPVAMALVFWLQQKVQPKPAVMNEQQAQQQKMMQWMTLLFPVFLYTAPSGLNLYILTSTTIGIIESKRIRDHIKQREEAEKAGKVIVDARPTRAAKRGKAGEEQPTQSGLAGWFAKLQQKAADMQRQAEKQRDKNR